MKYCEHCGNKIPLFQKCTCEAAQKQQGTAGEKHKPEKTATIALIFAALLIPILIVLSISSTINTFDYVEVRFYGPSGFGLVDVSIDKKALVERIIGEAPSETNFQEYIKWEMQYNEYANAISYTCDKTDDLSNGDSVTVTITATGIAASKIKSESKTFKVENLVILQSVDVFKDVEFKFDGVSGSASLKIKNNSENLFAQECRLSADNRYNLKNGDTITITLEYDLDDALSFNSVPKETVKTITVSGLPSYMTDISQLPTDDTLKNIAEEFLNNTQTSKEDDWLFSYSDFNYYKTWFLKTKADARYPEYDENCLIFCVSYKEYVYGEYNKTVYYLRGFRDVVVHPDGSVILDYDDSHKAGSFSNEASAIENWEEDYVVTEVFFEIE